mmetsp:Transcript_14564/g.21951  ORF Transcript_14564/g.21951 Transcript_14564/m.21951 type:complete len:434 (-) Transcript_14564:179-1480(-)
MYLSFTALFSVLIHLFYTPALCQSAVTDLILHAPVNHTFLETGFISLDDKNWRTITTRNQEFIGDVVVFISLPNIAGETSNDGYPAATKLRNKPLRNPDGSLTFDLKLVQPNDSFCDHYTVSGFIYPPLQVSWVVVEEGAYSFTGSDVFYISSLNITRQDDATDANNFNGNIIRAFYPTGCDSSNPSDYCRLENGGGTIAQLQTNNNVKEEGKDMFLLVRAKNVARFFAQYILVPHDAANYPSYYELDVEKLAFMVFTTGTAILCDEGMIIETAGFTDVTSTKVNIDFVHEYDYNPGVYGIIGTVTSLSDSTGLRVFDRTTTSSSIITQEDKCDDEETDHTTSETVYTVVVGESQSAEGVSHLCQVRFNSATITGSPSFDPTFNPTLSPTLTPTTCPSANPTSEPSVTPTGEPTGICLESTFSIKARLKPIEE